jgi:hypothetical protein
VLSAYDKNALALVIGSCPEAEHGLCYCYEYSRWSPTLRKIFLTLRRKGQLDLEWPWPKMPYLDIPQKEREMRLGWLLSPTRRIYLSNLLEPDWSRIHLSEPETFSGRRRYLIELPEDATREELLEAFEAKLDSCLGKKERQATGRAAQKARWRDGLRALGVYRMRKKYFARQIFEKLIEANPDNPPYSDDMAIEHAKNKAQKNIEWFTVEAMKMALEGRWVFPFGRSLV